MIKNIIFDFDGVILDSVPIKTEAFRKLFMDFPEEKVMKLLEYHRENGGISRYVKIRYFFEVLLGQSISEDEVEECAKRYSALTKEELTNPKYLIADTVKFISDYSHNYTFHIASGADENDLKYICDRLGLTKYFLSIHGSPTSKSDIVRSVMEAYRYHVVETCMIGDSINDFEAANKNNILFCGYNNLDLVDDRLIYLKNINDFTCIVSKNASKE